MNTYPNCLSQAPFRREGRGVSKHPSQQHAPKEGWRLADQQCKDALLDLLPSSQNLVSRWLFS